MATPPLIVELLCPRCDALHFEIDHAHRGMGGPEILFRDRTYKCPACQVEGTGFGWVRKSPPLTMLFPKPDSVVSEDVATLWIEIVRAHFPERYAQLAQDPPSFEAWFELAD